MTPKGGKLWRWAYRFEAKQKVMAFGRYPEVSLAEVREKHHEQRKLLGSGVDPMARRKGGKQAEKRRSEEVFANVAELWIEHWREGKSARHVDA